MADLIKAVEGKANPNIPVLKSGDSVSVHVRIKEGDKERVQEFKGTIIRMRKGGVDATFTVPRTALAWSAHSCSAHHALKKWKCNDMPQYAAHNCIICAT
jgi:ribosomal protein L19